MNGQYLSLASAEDLYPLVAPQLEKLGLKIKAESVLTATLAVKTRSRTTLDVARQVAVRLDPKFVQLDEKATKEIAKDPAGFKASLEASIAALRDADWTAAALEQRLRDWQPARRGRQRGVQPIRIALTGGTVPGR